MILSSEAATVLIILVALSTLAFLFFTFHKADQQRRELAEQAEAERAVERAVEEQIFTGDWMAGDTDGEWAWPETPLSAEPPFDWKKERLPELGL